LSTELAVAIVGAVGTVVSAVLGVMLAGIRRTVNGRTDELLDRITLLQQLLAKEATRYPRELPELPPMDH
jgi:hypothetical protein